MTTANELVLIEKTGTLCMSLPADVATTHPWCVEVICSPPEFMEVAFVLLYGLQERAVVRAVSQARLQEFVQRNDFKNHPRLLRMIVTGPNGFREETTREQVLAERDAARQQSRESEQCDTNGS